jgi:hypothetical protein
MGWENEADFMEINILMTSQNVKKDNNKVKLMMTLQRLQR